MQKTIQNIVTISGYGLHTGQQNSIRFLPAKENTGVIFKRIDLKGQPLIAATIKNIYKTKRRTVLKQNNATIETVEHVFTQRKGGEVKKRISVELLAPYFDDNKELTGKFIELLLRDITKSTFFTRSKNRIQKFFFSLLNE